MTKHTFKKIIWKGKDVGELRDDHKVFRTIRKPEHIYRKLNSVGFSEKLLDYLEKITNNELIQIHIKLLEPNNIVTDYRIALTTFRQEAERITNPQEVFTTDKQLHIDLDYLEELRI